MMTAYNKNSIIFLSMILLALSACKQTYTGISLGTFNETGGEISGFSKENYGYVIYDINNNRVVRGHNARKSFIPASVSKLFTTLFSIETLGTDYTFSTELSYSGSITNGILTGDLYLKGGGDPELSVDGLLNLISGLKEKEIREVKGSFFYDESMFAPREKLEESMPDEAFYNTGSGPLSFNGNIIYALQVKDRAGRIVSVEMLPALPSFSAKLYSGKPEYPFIKFSRASGREAWSLPDRYLWDTRQPLPVKNSGLYTAQVFHKLCAINGIKLPLPAKGKTVSSSKPVTESKSRPLLNILKEMIYTSNNLTAEIIDSVATVKYLKESGKSPSDLKAVETFYRSNFTAVNWDSLLIARASGLTTLNRATPEQTACVLLFIEKSKKTKLEYMLPLSGWDGTMKNRLDDAGSAFRVYGKTGSIFFASALAGVFYGKSGGRYIFSVFINDSVKRKIYDSSSVKSADEINTAGAWSKNASDSIDRFLLNMIEQL